jgi:hypothetical protein
VNITVRPFDGDPREFVDSIGIGFAEPIDDEGARMLESVLEMDRAIAAYDGDRIVGNAAALSFELTIPGGVLA